MTSRAQIAAYMADNMTHGRTAAVKAAASWLVDHGKARQARYLAHDVASALAERGYVLARVTTARPLSDHAKREVDRFIREQTEAKHLELVTKVDKSIIGGALIEVPGAELDSTVRTKLAKFVEGVSQ
jgi:F0F1-type ATP synthase delta subunit